MKVMPQLERTANSFTCMLVNFMMDWPRSEERRVGKEC